jgi:hypothetical protein
MKYAVKLTTVALALGMAGVTGKVALSADNWQRLGCKTVGFSVDKDTIQIGRGSDPVKRLKLLVKNAPIEFYELRVVFGNGQTENISIHQAVRAGSESLPINLPGAGRGIEKIDMLYRSIPTFKGNAEVCVHGKME